MTTSLIVMPVLYTWYEAHERTLNRVIVDSSDSL